MSAPDKPPAARASSATTPPKAPERHALGAAMRETAVDLARSAVFDRRPYLKYAFQNPYNLSLFLGALAAAGLTLNPLLALAAVGAEALWLLYAPDSKRLRHLLWDPRFEKIREALLREEREARMTGLDDADRARGRGARRAAAGDPRAGRAQPVVHRRPAARRTREDRTARGGVHRHGRHLRALRAVPDVCRRRRRGTRAGPLGGCRARCRGQRTRPRHREEEHGDPRQASRQDEGNQPLPRRG